jgi:hypothetical protein
MSKLRASIERLRNQRLGAERHFAGAQTKDARRRSLVQCSRTFSGIQAN